MFSPQFELNMSYRYLQRGGALYPIVFVMEGSCYATHAVKFNIALYYTFDNRTCSNAKITQNKAKEYIIKL